MNRGLLLWLYVCADLRSKWGSVLLQASIRGSWPCSRAFFHLLLPAHHPPPFSLHPDQLIDTCTVWHWEPAHSLMREIHPSRKSLSAIDTHAHTCRFSPDSCRTAGRTKTTPRPLLRWRQIAHKQRKRETERDGERQEEYTRVKALTSCFYRLKKEFN